MYTSPADYCYDAIGLVACAALLADKLPRANVTAEPTSRTFFSKRQRKRTYAPLLAQTPSSHTPLPRLLTELRFAGRRRETLPGTQSLSS